MSSCSRYVLSPHGKDFFSVDVLVVVLTTFTIGSLRQRAEAEASGQDSAQDDYRLNKQPTVLQNGTLREYQLEGLNWLVKLYANGISGILADEMGLGKTVQTVAMIGYLTEFKNAPGPHMVLAPKSTMSNWMKEFRKWLPSKFPVPLPCPFNVHSNEEEACGPRYLTRTHCFTCPN